MDDTDPQREDNVWFRTASGAVLQPDGPRPLTPEELQRLARNGFPDLARELAKRQTTLRVVTRDRIESTALDVVCTGSLTCECPDCTKARLASVRAGSRDRKQPWDGRRRRAA